MPTVQTAPVRSRRANALVLVTAVLVLLVIIATAFLVRSQTVRAQAAASQLSAGRDARVESVVAELARGIGDALFVQPVDPRTYQRQVQANAATGIDSAALGQYFARSDFPRLPPDPFGIRYEVDMLDGLDNRFLGPYVTDPNLPGDRLWRAKVDGYNYAPYSVIPFTNWPTRYGPVPGESDYRDWYTGTPDSPEPPAPYPQNFKIPTNPRGNPGFGDHRWLASTEPVRAAAAPQATATSTPQVRQIRAPISLDPDSGAPRLTSDGLAFSHWPHLSWIATANNGFRVCWDISNVEANTLDGAAGTLDGELALGTPYEQWLPYVAPREPALASFGGNPLDPRGYLALDWRDFRWRWANWFNRQVAPWPQGVGQLVRPSDVIPGLQALNTVPGHAQAIKGVTPDNAVDLTRRFLAPANFLQLAAYGDPSDEYKVFTRQDELQGRMPQNYAVGDPTPRNLISRTLADADGDGWTDSFWFTAPTSADRGTKQLVAVRIMDNSALLNVNVATRFERTNTVGQTPSDVALVSRRESYDMTSGPGANAARFDPVVGFLSSPENDPEWRTNPQSSPGQPGKALLPLRKLAATPDRLAPYSSTGWRRADTENPAGLAAAEADIVPVYRASDAIDVAFNPQAWEGRGTRSDVDDDARQVNTASIPGYFGRSSILAQLGLIKEGRFGEATDNRMVPLFSTQDRYGTLGPNGDFFMLSERSDRATYFKAMGSGGAVVDPVTSATLLQLTPFGIDDEIELRAFNGLNDAQSISRLESAMGWSFAIEEGSGAAIDQFLRSSRSREETGRFLLPSDPRVPDAAVRRAAQAGQLGANEAPRSGAELLLDHRRKLTTVSGARNDMLPPRLWTIKDYGVNGPRLQSIFARPAFDAARDVAGLPLKPPYHPNRMFPFLVGTPASVPPGPDNPWDREFSVVNVDGDPAGKITREDFLIARDRFIADNRKIDLRRPFDDAAPPDDPSTPTIDERGEAILDAQEIFTADIQRVIRAALIDNTTRLPANFDSPPEPVQVLGDADSYFGRPLADSEGLRSAANHTRALAASMAANIVSYRDGPQATQLRLATDPDDLPPMPLDQPAFPSLAEAVQWPSEDANNPSIPGIGSSQKFGFIGVEAHPVIQEVFIALVYPPNPITQRELDRARAEAPTGTDCASQPTQANEVLSGVIPTLDNDEFTQGAGEYTASFNWRDEDLEYGEYTASGGAPAVVFAVQVANPFNRPIKLADYRLRVNGINGRSQNFFFYATDGNLDPGDDLRWGNTYGPQVELGPCTPEEPRCAIVFAIPETFPNGKPFPRSHWLDFLDIGAPLDKNNDNQIVPDELSGPTSNYRDGRLAARAFEPDQTALFRPSWGNPASAPAGTLLFDATRRVRKSANAAESLMALGGFDVSPRRRSILSSWVPPKVGELPGRAFVELQRAVHSLRNPIGGTQQFAWVTVDRFENAVDPTMNRPDGGSGAEPTSGGQTGSASVSFMTMVRRVVPDFHNLAYSAEPDGSNATPYWVGPYASASGSMVPPTRMFYKCASGSGSGSRWELVIDGVRLGQAPAGSVPSFAVWARGARQWLYDVDGDGQLAADERVPRYAMSRITGVSGSAFGSPGQDTYYNGTALNAANSGSGSGSGSSGSGASTPPEPTGERILAEGPPDRQLDAVTAADGTAGDAWFVREYHNVWGDTVARGKPTFFGTRAFSLAVGNSQGALRRVYPQLVDGGWRQFPAGDYNTPAGQNQALTVSYGELGVTDPRLVDTDWRRDSFIAPLRLFQKDADFDQVAEVLDVPMWGPLVELRDNAPGELEPLRITFATLPEILATGGPVAGAAGSPPSTGARPGLPMFSASALSTNATEAATPRYGTWQQQVSWNRLSIEPPVYNVPAAGEAPGDSRSVGQLWGNQVLPSADARPASTTIGPDSTTIGLTAPLPRGNGIGFNPRLPGVVGLLDAFTLDDRGAAPLDANGDNSVTPLEWAQAEDRRLRLAGGFQGASTPGLINVNTAPVEVLRAMPHMTRLAYADDYPIRVTAESDPANLTAPASQLAIRMLVNDAAFRELSPAQRRFSPGLADAFEGEYGDDDSPFPRTRTASAIELYRNKLNTLVPDGSAWSFPDQPSYVDRGVQLPNEQNFAEFAPAMRVERGFESIGELGLLLRGAMGRLPTGDANGNLVPDVREIAAGTQFDVNRNGVLDPVTPLGSSGIDDDVADPTATWGAAVGWSMRFAGMDPFRRFWSDDRAGLGANSRLVRDILPPRFTQGVPLGGANGGLGFTLGGRTAIDDHLLIGANDNPDTSVSGDPIRRFDRTSGDALEQNQLLRGISNIVTTRSDVFTMWVRVRTIRQDPLTGKWNATDPDSILDDSRFLLTIDRSNVNLPGDSPRILGMVRVPK